MSGKTKKKNVASRTRGGAITLLVVILLIIAVAAFFTFGSFEYGDGNIFVSSDDDIYTYKGVINSISLGIDLKGGIYAVMEPDFTDMDENERRQTIDEINETMSSTIKILQNRLTSKGYPEASVVAQVDLSGVPKIRIEIPDVSDPEEVFNIIGKSAVLEFRSPDGDVLLTGDDLENAYPSMDENGKYVIGLEFNKAGAAKFKEATTTYLNKTIGIYIDDELVSEPTVNETISGGRASISGGDSDPFTYQYVSDQAMLLLSGSLGHSFKQVEPRVISATLGEEAITTSLIAGGIGILLVFLFMIIVYRGLGVVADIALAIYVILLLLLMSQLPWVQLTLPGIAGVLLSIGMAVDANVVIFERIKEEYASGKTFVAATSAAFKRATIAVVDSNVTTLIAAVVLWLLGAGTIQGFAITLFIGVIISMFTAIVITRWLIKLFMPITNSSEKFYGVKKEAVRS